MCYVQIGVKLCAGRVWSFPTFHVGSDQPDPRPNTHTNAYSLVGSRSAGKVWCRFPKETPGGRKPTPTSKTRTRHNFLCRPVLHIQRIYQRHAYSALRIVSVSEGQRDPVFCRFGRFPEILRHTKRGGHVKLTGTRVFEPAEYPDFGQPENLQVSSQTQTRHGFCPTGLCTRRYPGFDHPGYTSSVRCVRRVAVCCFQPYTIVKITHPLGRISDSVSSKTCLKGRAHTTKMVSLKIVRREACTDA